MLSPADERDGFSDEDSESASLLSPNRHDTHKHSFLLSVNSEEQKPTYTHWDKDLDLEINFM